MLFLTQHAPLLVPLLMAFTRLKPLIFDLEHYVWVFSIGMLIAQFDLFAVWPTE